MLQEDKYFSQFVNGVGGNHGNGQEKIMEIHGELLEI